MLDASSAGGEIGGPGSTVLVALGSKSLEGPGWRYGSASPVVMADQSTWEYTAGSDGRSECLRR